MNSLLGIKGYHSHGSSLIKLIEKDSSGRILFSYYDDTYLGNVNLANSYYGEDSLIYLICKKIDETYVYFYPDYNFIIRECNNLDIPFSDKEIQNFKNKNDWGQKINEKKLIKYEISSKKMYLK